MDFNSAMIVVKEALSDIGTNINTNDYDGLIVKELKGTNTLDAGRKSGQTHIAFTGEQMDIFPYLCADGYFFDEGKLIDDDLKKFFIISVPITIFESNCKYLGADSSNIVFFNGQKDTSTCIVRSKRKKQADQLQVSMLSLDGPDFVSFRRFLHTGTFFILLKCKNSMKYHAFGVIDESDRLADLNNRFYKAPSTTVVSALSFTESDTPHNNGKNILLYGVPGCGKSHTIKNYYCDNEAFMERIVFHPDYTNSDFIGQILPFSDEGGITYKFIPGPFTRIMRRALEDPGNMYYLVIEEINRGNAPAIFGEVFQLLDRVNGESEYGISNPDIAAEVYGDAEHLVKIPANLTILATMNTADQNVFTLDTAFKRRWDMVSIPNDFENCKLKDVEVGNTGVSWAKFADAINYLIVDIGASTVSSEDKRLGAYFVTADQLADNRKFAEKVLAYLWDDVFKYDRGRLFNSENRTLEELIAAFSKDGLDVFIPRVIETLKDSGSEI